MLPTLLRERGREAEREGETAGHAVHAPRKTGTHVATQHQFPNTLSKQEKERHEASVALKTEIRAMRLLVLASSVILICPLIGHSCCHF